MHGMVLNLSLGVSHHVVNINYQKINLKACVHFKLWLNGTHTLTIPLHFKNMWQPNQHKNKRNPTNTKWGWIFLYSTTPTFEFKILHICWWCNTPYNSHTPNKNPSLEKHIRKTTQTMSQTTCNIKNHKTYKIISLCLKILNQQKWFEITHLEIISRTLNN